MRRAGLLLWAAVIAVVACTVIAGVSTWWLTESKPTCLEERSIEVSVEDATLHYQERLVWSEGRFSEIAKDEQEFMSSRKEQFSRELSGSADGTKHADNFSFKLDRGARATVMQCDVHGAMIGKSYFTFRWLLDPLRLDFIDHHFVASRSGLFWQGNVSSVPTTITLRLPLRDAVYGAWHHPNGHCHAHVWLE